MKRVSYVLFSALTSTVLTACGDGPSEPPAPPAIPTSLQAATASATQIDLVWTDQSTDETGFSIERTIAGANSWAQAASVAQNNEHFSDRSLEPLTSYQYRVRAIGAETSSGYSNVASATTLAFAPEVVTDALPTGLVGSAYDFTLEATQGDGSYLWEILIGELPAGLGLEGATGVVSGVPEDPGVSDFTISVSGAGLSTQVELALTVYGVLTVEVAGQLEADLNRVYAEAIPVSGGDGSYSWTQAGGTLPPGLILDAAGILQGVPEELGEFNFSVEVESGDGQGAAADLVMVVKIGPVEITTTALDKARVGVEYEATLQALGGLGDYVWSVTAGELAEGLELEPTGVLLGTPTAWGIAQATIEARDPEGRTGSVDLTLNVCEGGLVLAVGETRLRPFPDDECGVVLAASDARYHVALMARRSSVGPSPVESGLQLRTTAGLVGESFPAALGARAPGAPAVGAGTVRRNATPDGGLDPETRALAEATERLHFQLREEEYLMQPNVRSPRPSVLGPPRSASRVDSRSAEPDETRDFFVRDPETGSRDPISATLRGVSASLYYYEDDGVVEEQTRATDEEVEALLDYYEAYGRAVIDDVFGGLGPAGTTNNFRDASGALELPASDIDENGGRMIVLQIRPSLMPSKAAAYVSSCDRRPRPENYNAGERTCRGSNQAEMFYQARPSSPFYLGTAVHEAKHVSSHGYAVFGGRGFNPSWIEEGTADLAKEKSSRDAVGVADGVEVGRVDIYPNGQDLTPSTYGMGLVNSRARSYLRASPISALIGNPNPNSNGSTYYGASWLFHRFLADNYAGGDEDAFFLTLNTGGAGLGWLEAVVGQSFETLMAEFMVAIAVEGHEDARAATAKRFFSYDLRDISFNFMGLWPYAQVASSFDSGDWILEDVHYTAPNFFDFTGDGAQAMRLDAMSVLGEILTDLEEVVLSVTRIR